MSSGVPQLENVCCVVNLRRGSLIILWVYLVAGILWMCSPTISGGYKSNSTIEITGSPTNPVIKYGYTLEESKKFDFANIYPSFGSFATVLGGISVIVGGYALFGMYQYKRCALKPYLFWEAINLSIILIAFFVFTFMNSFQLFPLVYLVFFLYFWLVIFSQYRAMKNTPKIKDVCNDNSF